MRKQKKSVRKKKVVHLEGVKPNTLNEIVKQVRNAHARANEVNTDSLSDLVSWLDVGEEMVKQVVQSVKGIKKSVLRSDAKTRTRGSVYITTTPLIKCKVKTADIRAVFLHHKQRLKNVASLMQSLTGQQVLAKKKGGNK